jgi:tRNA pseudouridine55 synthase
VQIKRAKRPISGVLLLDKPAGFSSNQALQRVKHLFTAAKAGHTGTLDPFATGLLPICFGEATKFSHNLLDADKAYGAVLKLGITTTTGDTEGKITKRKDVQLTYAEVEYAVNLFLGNISQVPPMHSALKHQGRPLYEYARAGVEIERKPREVKIHEIVLLRLEGDEAEVQVSCSKGTYIRVLAEDIGKQLGCGAHLIALRRLSTARFRLQDAFTLEQLETMTEAQRDQCLLSVDVILRDLPAIEFDEESTYYFRQGQPIWKSAGINASGMLRAYGPQGVFLGVAENMGDGRIAPRRLVSC